MCKDWAKNGACDVGGRAFPFMEHVIKNKLSLPSILQRSEFDNIEIWDFMMSACSKSCGFCGNKGCRNEHERCSEWAKHGYCIRNPFFMVHTCRESCGVCGFLSPNNQPPQTVHSQTITDYSNFDQNNFDCGRFENIKPKRSKRGSGGEFQSHKFSEGSISSFPSSSKETFLSSTDSYCGATLISDKIAISAAHCFDEFGTYSSYNSIKIIQFNSFNPEWIEVIQVYNHPDYLYPNLYNDIAILKLGRRIQFDYENTGVTPLCLKREPVTSGQLAKILGRGLTETGERGTLLESGVKIISNAECVEILSYNATDNIIVRIQIEKAFPYGLSADNICAIGFQNTTTGVFSGACKGDSGGPLYVDENGIKKLIGIVSGGVGCGQGYPGWFTNISHYIPWLECMNDVIQNNKRLDLVYEQCQDIAEKSNVVHEDNFGDMNNNYEQDYHDTDELFLGQ